MSQNHSPLTGVHYYFLKWIAIFTMLTDHIASCFLTENSLPYLIMRTIGRLAFPLFCFSLVESFWFTKDRKKHLLRLAMITLLSEIPFNLMERGHFFAPDYQNVCFTLCMGYIGLWLCDMDFVNGWNRFFKFIYFLTVFSLLALLNQAIHADYGFQGILLIGMFHFARNYEKKIPFQLIALLLFAFLEQNPFCFVVVVDTLFINTDFGLSKNDSMKKATKNKMMKQFCGFFYPAHLLFLFFLKILLGCF
mgnify:CR=1 FL=1